MPRIDTVAVGASAGGFEALSKLVGGLPADFAAAILVVVHFPETSRSVLPHLLTRVGKLPAKHADPGDTPEPGHIYVAPPGRHMLLRRGRLLLAAGAKENGNRPAIDPLFRTAARDRGPTLAAVLLSGMLDDGTLGMMAVNRHGGVSIAQNVNEAAFPDMPRNAILNAGVDYSLPVADIAKLLLDLSSSGETPASPASNLGKDPAEMDAAELARLEHPASPSEFTCPACQGTLFELNGEGFRHYRCRVGHAYGLESLADGQFSRLEGALWTALKTIEENIALQSRMLERAEKRGMDSSAANYRRRHQECIRRAEILNSVLGELVSADSLNQA